MSNITLDFINAAYEFWLMEIQYENGCWNDQPAKFRVVMAVVGNAPAALREQEGMQMNKQTQYPWFLPMIGESRQVVEVVCGAAESFYLDNEDGTGIRKVTACINDREYEYRLIYPSSIVAAVLPENWQYYSLDAVEVVNRTIADAWKEMEESS